MFQTEAKQIKVNNYAIDNEEFGKGIICYAAPVFDSLGDVVACVGVSSLTIYDDIHSLITKKGKSVTSVMNSSAQVGNDLYACGNPLMFTLETKIVKPEKQRLLRALIDGYFEGGGSHLQFNLQSADTLHITYSFTI